MKFTKYSTKLTILPKLFWSLFLAQKFKYNLGKFHSNFVDPFNSRHLFYIAYFWRNFWNSSENKFRIFFKHGNWNFWNVLQTKNGWQQTCPRLRGAPMTPIFNFSHGCGHDLTAPSDNFPHLEVEVKCRDWLFQAEIALLIFILFFPLQLLVE